MKKVILTKKVELEVPEDISCIIDGDKMRNLVNTVIQTYRRSSNHRDAETIQKVFNALLDTPDIYLYRND